ncbi:hypothetical protein C8R45DRAFT_1110005 [Mycena sanguinolenta]|nr:hypothetical protein C8R45DRAFT_1110005 [Mycena sanguinolenta]
MESSQFTFAFSLPTNSNSGNQHPTSLTAAPPVLTSFRVQRSQPTGSRAEVQACYRARNQEAERLKARQRMHEHRLDRKKTERERLRREASSEHLRSSDVFQQYKNHVQRHLRRLCGQHADTEYMRRWDQYRFSDRPFQFDEEDALFILKYNGPLPCLIQLNNCAVCLVFDWENEAEVDAYEKMLQRGKLDDDDIEFIFRHAEPTPAMETLASTLGTFGIIRSSQSGQSALPNQDIFAGNLGTGIP